MKLTSIQFIFALCFTRRVIAFNAQEFYDALKWADYDGIVNLVKDFAFAHGFENTNKRFEDIPYVAKSYAISGFASGTTTLLKELRFQCVAPGNEADSLGETTRSDTKYFPTLSDPMIPREYRSKAEDLPDPNVVFDELLKRKNFIPDEKVKSNFVFVSFVNFLFDGVALSESGSGLAKRVDRFQGSYLYMIYGRSKERNSMLRSYKNGKLRTSFNDKGEEVALMWKDVTGAVKPSEWHEFVLGNDRLNMHYGHLFWVSIYTKEHNRLCDILVKEFPDLSDTEIYLRARAAMHALHISIVVNSYASDFLVDFLAESARLVFDPELCFDNRVPKAPVTKELGVLYTMHNIVPDELLYEDKTLQFFDQVFEKPKGFNNFTLQQHWDAFHRTPAGAFAGNNIPEELRNITVMLINMERRNNMHTYLGLEHMFGFATTEDFESTVNDWSPEMNEKVAKLYKKPQDVESIVGMTIDKSDDHHVFPERLRKLLSAVVFAQLLEESCMQNRRFYGEEYLSKTVRDQVIGTKVQMNTFLSRYVNLANDDNSFTTVEDVIDAQPIPGIWDLRYRNIASYCGGDQKALWDHVMIQDEYYDFAMIIIILLMSFMFCYVILGRLLVKHAITPAGITDSGAALVLLNYAALTLFYALQLIPYTVLFIVLMFTSRFDIASVDYFTWAIGMVLPHGFVYLLDVVLRLNWKTSRILFIHHTFWFLILAIPLLAKDVYALKVGLVMDYFSILEVGLFWLLYTSKIQGRHLSHKQAKVGRFGVRLFVGTRFIQLVFLLQLAIDAYPKISFTTAVYWIQNVIILGTLYSQYQVAMSFYAWDSLWKRNDGKNKEENTSSKQGSSGNVSRTTLEQVQFSGDYGSSPRLNFSPRFSKYDSDPESTESKGDDVKVELSVA